jgi:hypothetical protein
MRAGRSISLLFLFVSLVMLGGCQNPSRIQSLQSWIAAKRASEKRFEISIDGVPRSHRDHGDMAIEATALAGPIL